MTVSLFRAVSLDELSDIAVYDGFRPAHNSLEGKWFAESEAAAVAWAQLLYPVDPFRIIRVDLPNDVADQMFRLPSLDQIGPARYAEGELLELVNQTKHSVAEV
jgi:hypothetical protein